MHALTIEPTMSCTIADGGRATCSQHWLNIVTGVRRQRLEPPGRRGIRCRRSRTPAEEWQGKVSRQRVVDVRLPLGPDIYWREPGVRYGCFRICVAVQERLRVGVLTKEEKSDATMYNV